MYVLCVFRVGHPFPQSVVLDVGDALRVHCDEQRIDSRLQALSRSSGSTASLVAVVAVVALVLLARSALSISRSSFS